MVRSTALTQHERNRPDPVRITAISVAIVANLTIFAALMQPMSVTLPAEPTRTELTVKFIPPKPEVIKPPVVPVVPHTQKTPQPQPRRHDVRPLPKPQPPLARVDAGPVSPPLPQPPPLASRAGDGDGDGNDVVTAPMETALMPLVNPAPSYPRDAMREGVTGTVMLELLVGVDGRVLDVRIVRGSGDRRLDAAAREQVLRNWRFQPAVRDGLPIRALGRVPIVFKLDGND